MLSVPIADKIIATPQQPQLSMKCPTLSLTEIETLQAQDVVFCKASLQGNESLNDKAKEKKHLVYLPSSVKKLMVIISVHANKRVQSADALSS